MKIAVVGSGVSGLAASWLLNEFSDHEVHLYEADARPGGHANTVSFSHERKKPVDVDTGFIVFNPSTYPNFLRFLNMYPSLRDRICPTTMTLSVSRDGGAFEWAGNSLSSVFCQTWRIFDPNMWRLLYDILRFNACARQVLCDPVTRPVDKEEPSIGEYLHKNGYSSSFRDNYLIPMTAAIWSTPPDKCALDFPARTVIQFMHNHHLLQILGKPSWLTLRGGSRVYVEHILSTLPPSQLHISTPVKSIASAPADSASGAVVLTTSSGQSVYYDHVVLACHSDSALAILRAGGGVTEDEERILSAFEWSRNEAVLHCDERLMPKRRIAWSCWNYLTTSGVDKLGRRKANIDQVSLTYWMNDLQHISENDYGPIFVTLNPPFDPDPERVVGRYQYEHPVLGTKAVRAQQELPAIQHKRAISFAGAWVKYGFHEDGFTSGLRAATAIIDVDGHKVVRMPFEILDADRTANAKKLPLASLFDALEGTGLRMIVGAGLALGLFVLRSILEMLGVELGHRESTANIIPGKMGLS